jgi:hypothetical protein
VKIGAKCACPVNGISRLRLPAIGPIAAKSRGGQDHNDFRNRATGMTIRIAM